MNTEAHHRLTNGCCVDDGKAASSISFELLNETACELIDLTWGLEQVSIEEMNELSGIDL